jgi:outer membrane receptor protein involved in Fe transport
MDKKVTARGIRYGVALALYSGMWAGAQAGGLSQPVNFHIPPEPMPPALMQFSDQANVQVVTQADNISKSHTQGVSGLMSVTNGLDRLLKGTPFSYALIGGKTVAINKASIARRPLRHPFNIAQANVPQQKKADPPAQPQAQEAKDPPQNPAKLHKVTVTGTRIKRASIETAQPITRISRQQIQESGYTNVGDFLGQLSFAGAHASTRHNTPQTTINLRNLGANRNLVLVDGKRWISGLGGTTNLNTIPTSIIDHIEILQDGASAVYGSDAIAGVVNIITAKNFKGAEAHAYYGIRNDRKTGSWDGQIRQYDVTIGDGNGRGNVVFNATYREQNAIFQSARVLHRTAIAGITPGGIGGASATPRGRFQLFGPALSGRTFGQGTCDTYDPSQPTKRLCDLTLVNAPAQPSLQNFRNWRLTDGANDPQDEYLQPPLKDVSLYVQGHYDLFNNVTFSANAAYIRDTAKQHQPSEEMRVGSLSTKTANGQKIGISRNNPYNPFGKDLVASTTDPCIAAGSCIGLGQLTRRIPEGLPLIHHLSNDYFHIFLGFNGYVNLFSREVDWDVGFAQNRVQSIDSEQHSYNLVRVAQALGPAAQCTSPCVPLNFFGGSVKGGPGSIAQNQIDYIQYEPHDLDQSNLRDWTANLSSDVYDLPAGPLGVAIGYERLDNYGYHHPDSIRANGNDSGYQTNPLHGRVVRNAEYAELNIPLLADLPGAKSLSVDIANRWTQFKRAGGVPGQSLESFVHNSSGRLNIRYQVNNNLLLRASWSQGFRSPDVSELFSGQFPSYLNLVDPCAGGTYGGYSGSGPLPPNCPNGTEDSQPNSIFQTTVGSNTHLKPEKSISRTVGFVYSPSQVPGLDINADYFKIEINNTIGSIGAQTIVNSCFNDYSFCNLITTQSNEIIDVRNVNTNVGSELTEGIDVGLNYKFPSTSIGDFDARINGTFLKAFDITKTNRATATGFATSHLAGITEHPKRRFNGYLDWDYGNWAAQYHIEYYDSAVDQCEVAFAGYCSFPKQTSNYQGALGQFPLGRNHLGSMVYHDINIAYTVPSINTTFAVGVNNLFDKKPPITGGGGFDTNFYRRPSRLIYGDIRVRF